MASQSSAVQKHIPALSPVFPEKLRFIKPTVPALDDVIERYAPSYQAGMLTNSAVVGQLEDAVAERLQVRHCVAVSSCTTGLMLVLRALGIRGDIAVPSFTFFATGHAVLWNGLRPVFADCDRHTWTVDPADVANELTEKTEAILAVHLYGNPCNVEALERLATRHKLKLIFDAAHAFGSARNGRPIGQFGDAEVFSLSPTKLLVAGEGGLVTTNDATLARLLRAGRNYGDLGGYDPELIGINARMSEYNAALALSGLDLLDAKLKRRNTIATTYTALLSPLPGLSFQRVAKRDEHTYKDYSILIDEQQAGISRDALADCLLAANIETKKYFYPPLHQQKLYRQYGWKTSTRLTATDLIASRVLSLPIYESLSDETVAAVANAIALCCSGNQQRG
jgi:dTDP-4-amino-4,6-dideoxygalactose transaminase